MKEAVDHLIEALRKPGSGGVEESMPRLLAELKEHPSEREIRRALEALRSARCFSAMESFASRASKLANGSFSIYVRRQLAQARVDLGLLDEAIGLLDSLVEESASHGTPREQSEVLGLLGRAIKQRFVESVRSGKPSAGDLRASIRYYERGFDLDPGWHGANLVALLARAKRDGIAVEGATAKEWARRLLDRLAEKSESEWSPWDHASAGEAYLALDEADNAADSFRRYWTGADPFALGGTVRQLKEIWQIDEHSEEYQSTLLAILEASYLGAPGARAKYTAEEMRGLAAQLQAVRATAEARFGAGAAIPVERLLGILKKAESVCRVFDSNDPRRGGTGFLVNGRHLSPELPEKLFLLTNHHVLHGGEASESLLEEEEYRGSVPIDRALADFHYWSGKTQPKRLKLVEVVRHSPRPQLDFALASLEEEIPLERAVPLTSKERPLGSRNFKDPKQRPKIFVIGHPEGGSLSFSFSDNEVVDHELDDRPPEPGFPRRIHYRAPTEPGSSGSPVLHDLDLDVVGLHRSGHAHPLRPDWPGKSDKDKYEANEAVSIRSIRESL